MMVLNQRSIRSHACGTAAMPAPQRALLMGAAAAPRRRHGGGNAARSIRPTAATGNSGAGAPTAVPSSWRTTEGKPLTRDEAASLARTLAATTANNNNSAAPLSAAVTQLLRDGAAKRAKDLPLLEGAVLLAEQGRVGGVDAAAGAPESDSVAAAAAVTVWQPIFASAGGVPRLLYIPVPEYFDVSAAAAAGGKGAIDIVTELGPVTTHFLGTCEWTAAGDSGDSSSSGNSSGSSSTLEYAIERCVVRVPAWEWFRLAFPFPLRNALAFFYYDAGARVAAARSRLGGTMLLRAEPAAAAKYVGGAAAAAAAAASAGGGGKS